MNRVAPLAQLLGQASERESDRELIRLFGEAIAVWHDIEVSGYVETTNGAFARDVTLPGTKKGERPAIIASVGLPDSTELTRLPQGHLDRFGLPVNSDVYVRRFKGTGRRAWLLVFTGEIGAYDLQRISAYVALLDLALSLSTTSFTARILTAIKRAAHWSGRHARDAGHSRTRRTANDARCGRCDTHDRVEERSADASESPVLTVPLKPSRTRARSDLCSSNDQNGITLRPFRWGATRACNSLLEITRRRVQQQRCSMRGLQRQSAERVCVANGVQRRVVSRRSSSVQRARLSIGEHRWP